MPGQHKRRERGRRRAEARSDAHASAPWEHVFSTEDPGELRAYVHGLTRSGNTRADDIRVDTLCGRLTRTTHYEVSVRTPEA
ncbi:hypothetical protein ACWGHM_24480 [Streptomyces sp. NPDC054904]|uniref:hypothetical protein n=1 Tax=Streptomyces sp. NPDC090054 TaxID=3365933 RepID=UPI0037FE5660